MGDVERVEAVKAEVRCNELIVCFGWLSRKSVSGDQSEFESGDFFRKSPFSLERFLLPVVVARPSLLRVIYALVPPSKAELNREAFQIFALLSM